MNDGLQDSHQHLLGGAFWLTLCSLISQVINYGIHIGLGRFFAPAVYGYFGIIVAAFSIIEAILRWGVGRAVAFYVAQDKEGAKHVLKKSLQLQTIYAGIWFFLFLSFADGLAAILGDPGLSSYLRWGAFFTLTFSFVPVYSGFLNGAGAFRQQGAIVVIRSFAKLLLIVVLLVAGMEIYGVIVAYMGSTLLATLYGSWASRPNAGPARDNVEARNIISFGFPLFISALSGSLLMRMDLFLIQSLLSDRVLTGLYASASALIKAPYFLSHGTGLVVFRTVARLKTRSPSEVQRFIGSTLYRYILMLAPIPFILSAGADQILALTFGDNYLGAAPAFKVLAFCLIFMILHELLTSVVAALGHARLSMTFSLSLLPLQLFLIYEWISAAGLVGAALATTLCWALGVAIACVYLLARGYLVLPKWTVLFKIGVASLLSYYGGLWAPANLWLLAFCPLMYLLYLGLLKLMGEFSNGEVRTLIAMFLPAKTHSA